MRRSESCGYPLIERSRRHRGGRHRGGIMHDVSPWTGMVYHAGKRTDTIKLATGVRARIDLSWLNRNLPARHKRQKRTSKPLRPSRRPAARLTRLKRKSAKKPPKRISVVFLSKLLTSLR